MGFGLRVFLGLFVLNGQSLVSVAAETVSLVVPTEFYLPSSPANQRTAGNQCRQPSLRELSCEIRQKALGCDSLPPSAPRRSCANSGEESGFLERNVRSYLSCVKGIYGATIGETVALFTSAVAETERRARYYNPGVYKRCTEEDMRSRRGDLSSESSHTASAVSVGCKSRLLEEFPDLMARYRSQFNSIPYAELHRIVLGRLREIADRQPSIASFVAENKNDLVNALRRKVDEQLEKWQVRLACYTDEAITELNCAAVAAVVSATGAIPLALARLLPRAARVAEGFETAILVFNRNGPRPGEPVLTVNSLNVPNSHRIANGLREVVQDIDSTLLNHLERPPQVNIDLSEAPFGHQYLLEQSRVSLDVRTRLPELRMIAAHEYAHQIFSYNMRNWSEEWKRYYDFYDRLKIEVTPKLNDLSARHSALMREFIVTTSPERKAALQNQMEKLLTEGQALRSDFVQRFGGAPQRPRNFEDLIPYEEVFADLVPVLRTRNPEVIADALSSAGQAAQASGRSFASGRPTNGVMVSENHEMLSQTRQHLWQNYISQFPNRSRDSEFLERVHRVFAQDFLDRQRGLLPHSQSPEAFNQRLIQRLDADLSDFRPRNN